MPEANNGQVSAVVTFPDGRRARVSGPTREAVQQQIDELQRQYGQEPERDTSLRGRAARAGEAVGQAAIDINTGLVSAVPGLRGLVGGTIGRAPGVEAETPVGTALEYVGAGAGMAAGGLGAMGLRGAGSAADATRRLAQTAVPQQGFRAGARRMADRAVDFVRANPGTFAAGEIGGAAGAGLVAHEMPENMPAQVLAGAVGGSLPAVAQGVGRGTVNTLARITEPFSRTGAERSTARRLQGLVEDPDIAARSVLEGVEGVTPAARTGERRLMALEARIREDFPQLDRRLREDLVEASAATRRALLDETGRPQSDVEWRRSSLQSIAPPGTEINAGLSDEMLSQAYDSFQPLYGAARGHPITPALQIDQTSQISLPERMRASVRDPSIYASPEAVSTAERFLVDQAQGVLRRADTPEGITSDALLEMRHNIRQASREARDRSGGPDREARRLLAAAERNLTDLLERQLPPDAVESLRLGDSHYGRYKVFEDAVYRAGDNELTADNLSAAIRSATRTPSMYARGTSVDETQMRSLVQAGRDPGRLIGNPALAARAVRDTDEAGRAVIHSNFLDELQRRAYVSDQFAPDGTPLVDGARLQTLIRENEGVLRAMRMDSGKVSRLKRLAHDIETTQRAPTETLAKMFDDGPETVLELIAAYTGARTGGRMGGDIGSGILLANFMSNLNRRALRVLFNDKRSEVLREAIDNPELYRALLVRPTDPIPRQERAAQQIMSWMFPSVMYSTEPGDLNDRLMRALEQYEQERGWSPDDMQPRQR